MNRNGYVREPAIRYLRDRDSPITLPFVLLRASDHIPKIRGFALEAIEKQMERRSARSFVEHFRHLEKFSRALHGQLHPVYSRILDRLFSPPILEQVLSEIGEYRDAERLYIYRKVVAQRSLSTDGWRRLMNDRYHLNRKLARQEPKNPLSCLGSDHRTSY